MRDQMDKVNKAHREGGWAMLQVLAVGTIASIFIGIMFTVILTEIKGSAASSRVTTSRQAAEAGVEQLIFDLGKTGGGGDPWDTFPTTYATGAATYEATIGDGKYAGHIDLDPTSSSARIITMTGYFPATNTAQARTVRVRVGRSSPEAFDYSMFADEGLDLHHHGGWLAPEIVTNAVHSNGYAKIDYPSDFTLERFQVVTNIEFQKGGGSTPGGSVPTSGYNWKWILPDPDVCFPGRYTTVLNCDPNKKYPGDMQIRGDIFANSVTVKNRGRTRPASGIVTETGLPLATTFGDVKASTASLNGSNYSTPGTYTSATCSQCGKGASAVGGQIGGNLTIQSGYAPGVIPFPSIDYENTIRARALTQPGQHVFEDGDDLLDYVTDPGNGMYRIVDPSTGALSQWNVGNSTHPGAILMDGDWVVTDDKIDLSWSDMLDLAKDGTGLNLVKPPVLLIRGSLVSETDDIKMKAPTAVVGKGNRVDFLKPDGSVDLAKFLDPDALEPGIVAAGSKIDASDYDDDSNWTSPSQYEPNKAASIWIRGLAYVGEWDDDSESSEPGDFHWHNYDPKNAIKIYGAQVGGKLHNCNNFFFTYDPLVKKAFGFEGSAGVTVLDWTEL